MADRICSECGARFEGRGDARYCSAACRQKAHRQRTGGGDPMTSGERKELMALVRRREKLAKQNAEVRARELMADFEHQMASMYSWDEDAVWAEAMQTATQAIAEADAKVAERCRELGIPEQYRGGHQRALELPGPECAQGTRAGTAPGR
jgi:hypothetical protein